MHGSPLISWKLLRGGKLIVLAKMPLETELESSGLRSLGLAFPLFTAVRI